MSGIEIKRRIKKRKITLATSVARVILRYHMKMKVWAELGSRVDYERTQKNYHASI